MNQIQKQIIYKAVSDPVFGKGVFDQIPLKDFDDDCKVAVTVIKRYYKTANNPLDENTFLTLVEDRLDKLGKSLEEQVASSDIISSLYQLEFADVDEDTINERIQNFVRSVLSRDAIMNAVGKGELSADDTLEGLIKDLRDIITIDVSGKNSEIIDFFEDVELKRTLLDNLVQNVYPTGFFGIDAKSDGGIARGEVLMANAETGKGKTTIAVNLARNYVLQGLNVLYIPLEEKVDRMIVRLEQLLSQKGKKVLMPNNKLVHPLFDAVQEAYKALRDENNPKRWGNLWIRKYKPQELTPNMLSQLISDLMIRKGLQVDVVIIDYPDLMRNPYENNSSESDAGGKLYEDIRAVGQEYDYLTITLSQLNRTSYGQDIKNSSAIEGSKRKMNAVDLAFTLNQTDEEFKAGFLRLYLDKVRNPTGGESFDRMVYLKVDIDTVTLRDETPDEHEQHLRILGSNNEFGSDDRKQEKNTYSPQKVRANTDELNGKLQEVANG